MFKALPRATIFYQQAGISFHKPEVRTLIKIFPQSLDYNGAFCCLTVKNEEKRDNENTKRSSGISKK